MEVFKMGQDWLVRRKRLSPEEDSSAPGIEAMRQLVHEEMEAQRVIRVPKPKAGRPTKAEAQVRADFAEVTGRTLPPADDSKLRTMLEKGLSE